MANVEHSTLTTTNLHENKGVSTASANTVATAVAGVTVWAKLTADNLTGTGNAFGAQLLHVRDEKASGTNAGTFSAGSWVVRTLNTTKTNQIGASLGSNQITLLAGTYMISARAPGNFVNNHQLKLRNVTDAADTFTGSTNNATNCQTDATLMGQFTISGSKIFELQHQCGNTTASDGLGNACGFGNTEVYAEVLIWKVL